MGCFCWESVRVTPRRLCSHCAITRKSNISRYYRVKRTAKSSSALTTAPPNSPTWFSWWSSTSSTEECCLLNSNTRAPSWPYDIFGSSDPPMNPYHLIWLCLKQTKQLYCWLVLFLFLSLQEAGELTDVSLSFYTVASPPETADLLESFFLHGCLRSRMHNLLARFLKSRREKIKEMNTAVCVNVVAESSTILLPIVINKLGHIVLWRSSRIDCVSSSTGQSAVWTSLRTNCSLIQTSSKHMLEMESWLSLFSFALMELGVAFDCAWLLSCLNCENCEPSSVVGT